MSNVNGCDCSIVIVQSGEAGLHRRNAAHFCTIPYCEETIREAVSLLTEEAAIEGDGLCRAIRKSGGVTGCVVTPLTIGTAPLLLALALGEAGGLEFVSETRGLYRCSLNLLPMEGGPRFDLVQERAPFGTPNGDAENQGFSAHLMGGRILYEGCRVKAFELRINRGEAVKLRLDISGDYDAVSYPYISPLMVNDEERFKEDGVSYRINGQEYTNIYGLTLSTKKEGGTRTELWIKRNLEQGSDLPGIIEELTITAQLLRDKYEYRHYGMFRITLKGLVLVSDETDVDCADGVIGPLRYYVAGKVSTEVFSSCNN